MKSRLDFRTATLTVDGKSYSLAPVGPAAQELVLAKVRRFNKKSKL